jgi:DNA topoisomerase-1
MDIIRKTNYDGNFFYVNKKSKKKIKNLNLLKHIKSLRIPPAYKNVEISSNIQSKVQAKGIDTKERSQYIYNKEYIEQQSEIKFDDLIFFGKKIKRIRRDVQANIKQCSNDNTKIQNKECLISLVIFIIDKCNFRVGNEKYKKLYNSFGVTTLNKKHFEFLKNNLKIKFIGKKGILNESKVDNKEVVKILDKLCNYNFEYIFSYKDNNGNIYRITEKHINDFLKKYHKSISVKMFRTWSANYILVKEILDHPMPNNQKEASKYIREIIKKAANKMHHSNNVSKKSYMNNKIINLYLEEFDKFKDIINNFRKSNGELPNINALLNKLLQYLSKK